ncbi:MAG: Bax inhibitor-1 family protein [Eggerthellales bacterium]|nr:Bax inhibitor-1 family protein [Eggerthellales bacterium]
MLAMLNVSNYVIQSAFIATAIVSLAMIVAYTLVPHHFAKLSHSLFISLLVGIAAQVLCAFLLPSISGIFNWVFVLIFSGYIGYDWYRAQNVAPTADNAIDCACALYMDIVNLFIRLLRIFEKK